MTLFDIAALLLALGAMFGLINHHLLRPPSTIGLVVIALAASIAVMVLDWLAPGLPLGKMVRKALGGINFYDTVINGMLAFLLFAGALLVQLSRLAQEKWPVLLTATVDVLLSTAVVGFAFAWATSAPLAVALVFGALISPTDPAAVTGVVKEA